MLCFIMLIKCIVCFILLLNDMLCIIFFIDDVISSLFRWIGLLLILINGSISLFWTIDEVVTLFCIVYFLVKDKNEFCNNEWVGIDLRNGEYTLIVKMVDGFGNKA